MSYCVVEDKTINRIVTWMVNYSHESPSFLHEIRIGTSMIPLPRTWQMQLGRMMRELNVAAASGTYNEGEKSALEPYVYRPTNASNIQVLKSLQCWMYQCCEGDIPKTPLYKFFDEFIEPYLMRIIIRELPEYNKAEWA